MTKIGLVQLTSGIDPLANAALADQAVRRAATQGAKLILTPEMTGLLDGNKQRLAANALPFDREPTVRALAAAARATGTWVLIGSVPVPGQNGLFANRSVLLDDQGEIVTTYDKLHLFDVDLPSGEKYRESSTYQAGTIARLAETPFGRLGLTICYDVRFPHLYRRLAQAGADMIAVPAAFTKTTGLAHWHVLLRARAIETGCFILAAAQTGTHDDGRTTFGHSLIVSPWGDIIHDMGVQPGTAVVEIELAQVAEARSRIPAWQVNKSFEVVA